MAAQLGRALLVQMDNADNDTFVTIAGGRTHTLTINETEVDVTSKDDAGIRQLLSGNILRTVSISGSGVFTDAAGLNIFRDAALAGTHKEFKVVIPGTSAAGGAYQGFFRITSFEESGEHVGEVQYSFTLASAGAVTWTDAT